MVWRNTVDWFDAIKIGLTATRPHTRRPPFEHLVYRYDYERAVREQQCAPRIIRDTWLSEVQAA